MGEVFDRYVDTAGKYHYSDTETGHHVITIDDPIGRQAAFEAFEKDIMGGLNYRRILRELPPFIGFEVIQCKDCKYSKDQIADGRYWCEIHNSFMYYCSDAERRIE